MFKNKAVSTPYLVWSAFFVIVPLGLVAYYALTSKTGQFTLDNLARVGQYAPVIMSSILLSIIATIISLIIAYPLAYIMSRSSGNTQRTVAVCVIIE